MDSLRLRFANRDDAYQLADLFGLLGHKVAPASIERRWCEWSAMSNAAIVAEHLNGRLVGLVTFCCVHAIHREVAIGQVSSMVVESEYRGRGLGRNLITTAETELVRRGCRRIEIVSNSRFEVAHGFYEHLGYRVTGVRMQKEFDGTGHENRSSGFSMDP